MGSMMKAVGFKQHLPISDPNSLIDFTVPKPEATGRDLLVHIDAVSVNPVDVLVRRSGHGALKQPKVIGWDAAGTVEAIGDRVTFFAIGDRVFYAGSFIRPGSDSEFQLVDERLVGHAPTKLTDAQAAAMPLTALTAWEALFEQLEINPENKRENRQHNLLIISGAGGVGSVAVQLAHWAGLRVIASASRPETVRWTKQLGANETVNHRKNLVAEVSNLGYRYMDSILELNDLDGHWEEMAEIIQPNGRIVSITENRRPVDLQKLTKKRAKFAWEWMYTKSYYQTDDMASQHAILDQIADLLDTGTIRSTLTRQLGPINAENLRRAHAFVETNRMIGKVVVANR